MLIYNHKYEGRSNSERGGGEEQFIFFRALFLFSFQLLPFQIRCFTLGVSDIKKKIKIEQKPSLGMDGLLFSMESNNHASHYLWCSWN